jgi:hypothetical protein
MADGQIKILTKAEKAAEMRVSTDTVDKLAKAGRLRKIQLSAHRVGFFEGETPTEPATA